MPIAAEHALTPVQRQHFIEHGYIKLEGAFPRELALAQVRKQFAKEGMDADKPQTWKAPTMRIAPSQTWDLLDLSPRLWAAACELLGGEDRVMPDCRMFRDHLIANLFFKEGEPWTLPGKNGGWHKDGQFFRHFLDSPEQALLGIVLWSDVVHQGGATFIAPQSIGAVARYLSQHPEGVHPNGFPWQEFMSECPIQIEATGQAGDVYLMHSYMLHTLWINPSRKLRCIDNAIYALKEPMNFNRADPADFSPLELAVLRGLGKERFDFKATRGERIPNAGLERASGGSGVGSQDVPDAINVANYSSGWVIKVFLQAIVSRKRKRRLERVDLLIQVEISMVRVLESQTRT